MSLIIKGKLFSTSNPFVCVPIVETGYDDIIKKAARLVSLGVDMVEWRIDYYEDYRDIEALNKALLSLRSMFVQTIFLVTLRTANEGGNADIDMEEARDIITAVGNSRCADLVDVEYFQYANPGEIIRLLQEKGCAVIASHHDFYKTENKQVNIRLLETMIASDPDIVKLCTMPNSPGDVFELGGAACHVQQSDDIPMIIIGMGEYGTVTRLVPGAFNSCVTFGSVDKTSAPGQIEYGLLNNTLEITKGFY